MEIFFKNGQNKSKFESKVRNVYLRIKSQTLLYQRDGDTACCLISLFIVAQKEHLIKNTQEFCMRTRLSSVPTIRKLMKKYITHEIHSI